MPCAHIFDGDKECAKCTHIFSGDEEVPWQQHGHAQVQEDAQHNVEPESTNTFTVHICIGNTCYNTHILCTNRDNIITLQQCKT